MFIFKERYTLDSPVRNPGRGDCGKKRVIRSFLKTVESFLLNLSHDKFSKGFGTRRVEITIIIKSNDGD